MKGNCKLLKIIVSEDSVYKGKSLYSAVVMKLKGLEIAGATVTRGIEGYGKSGRINTERILDLSSSLPVVIEAVDLPEKIADAIPEIEKMVGEGLILTADVHVVK